MMGALFQETCYPSQADATDAFYSSAGPLYLSTDPVRYTFYSKGGGAWQACEDVGGTVSCLGAAAPVFPACSQSLAFDSFTDGMTLGWGVVAAMAIAWGFRLMTREAQR